MHNETKTVKRWCSFVQGSRMGIGDIPNMLGTSSGSTRFVLGIFQGGEKDI
jgi:hypothetical protein